jgi:hypothetical protein
MDTETLLRELSSKIKAGTLTRETVLAAIGVPQTVVADTGEVHRSRFSLTKILYILGGSIAALGLVFFIAQIWDDIGSLGRIFVTLMMGLVLSGIGSLLLKTKPETKIGEVFQAIAGLLIPGGAMVALNELGHTIDSLWPVTITIGAVFAFYILLNLYHKNIILTFFEIANGTAFIYLLVESMISGPAYQHQDMYAYLTMVVGISYLLLALSFKGGWNARLIGLVNFVGSAGFFGAAFSRVFDSGLWEFLLFVFTVGGMALSIYIKSRAILVVSTLFLIAHFVYITNEYFADSIGWPISLVVLGFLFIGLGYVSISLNKKYIAGV